MPALALGLLLLLAVPIDLFASSASTCATFNGISNGDYSEVDFFFCLRDGDNLTISWTAPEDFLYEYPYQVEYQCYNGSSQESSKEVNYESNVVIKAQSEGKESMNTAIVPQTNSLCLVIGCYQSFEMRGDNFHWLKKADCISNTIISLSSVETITVSTMTTVAAVPSPALEESTSSSGDSPVLYSFEFDTLSLSESSTADVLLTFFQTTSAVVSHSVMMETLQPFSLITLAFSFSIAVVLAVTVVTTMLVCSLMCWKQKRNKSLLLKGEEREILGFNMKNREFLSLSLSEVSVIITPYTSLESIYIHNFEKHPHHVITVRQEGSSNIATDELCDSSCKHVLNSLSPEKTEFSSFTSDEGYIHQGSPPPYDTSTSQQFTPESESVMDFSRSTSDEYIATQ